MDADRRKLVKLCATRFVERHQAVSLFWDQLPAIVLALEMISEWREAGPRQEANNLLCTLKRSQHLISLEVIARLAGLFVPVTAALQGVQVN